VLVFFNDILSIHWW